MTPQPIRRNTTLDKLQTGLISLAVLLMGKLVSVGGDIYKNQILVKSQMEVIIEQQHDATVERNNIRLHQVDQDARLSNIESLLITRKNTN